MPPVPPRQPAPLQYLSISDFSPGIISDSHYAAVNSPLPAPQGAAQPVNTYRCMALPAGGLGPLPALSVDTSLGTPNHDTLPAGSTYYIVGLFVITDVVTLNSIIPITTSGTEVHIAWEYINPNTSPTLPQRRFSWQSALHDVPTPVWNLRYNYTGNQRAAPIANAYGASFTTTRMSGTSPYTDSGVAVVAMSWADIDAAPNAGIGILTFPNPASPSTPGSATILAAPSVFGPIFAHQDRVVQCTFRYYDYGTHYTFSNEVINYTDPPNSNSFGTQNEFFAPEAPSSYGAIHSANASELLLIKHRGGAVIIYGDLNYPNVTYLSQVHSTGGISSVPTPSPIGLVYCTEEGIWVWGGGNSSQKISPQLEDNFYKTNPLYGNAYTLTCMGDWVFLPNNYLYNTTLQSWWVVEDQSVVAINYWATALNSRVFGCPYSITDTQMFNNEYIWRLDKATPATSYSWQSHPIRISENRLSVIREVILRATGNGTIAIYLTDHNGNQTVYNFVVNSTAPITLRASAAVRNSSLTPRIISTAAASGPAPIVYSVDFGYEDSHLVNAA